MSFVLVPFPIEHVEGAYKNSRSIIGPQTRVSKLVHLYFYQRRILLAGFHKDTFPVENVLYLPVNVTGDHIMIAVALLVYPM